MLSKNDFKIILRASCKIEINLTTSRCDRFKKNKIFLSGVEYTIIAHF